MNHMKSQINSTNCFGLTGQHIGVAVLDTGCFLHEDLSAQITGFYDTVHKRQTPYDDNGHGTHVCGIICGNGSASNGRFCGIAPKCRLFPVKVLDRHGSGYTSDVLAGLRWVREHQALYNIRIVNISVGSFSHKNMSENSAIVRGVDEAWDQGLIVVVAAGNMGPKSGTITTPGISRKVITVGCSDDDREVRVLGNRMIHYSGRGPTKACVCKPDIIAPGAYITSCSNMPGKYTGKSGTSMATPLVSGALALLLEKYPEMTNLDAKMRLWERAVDLGLPKNRQGHGLLDIHRLLA